MRLASVETKFSVHMPTRAIEVFLVPQARVLQIAGQMKLARFNTFNPRRPIALSIRSIVLEVLFQRYGSIAGKRQLI